MGDERPDEAREGLSDDAMFWMIPSSTKLGDDPGLITALLFPMVEESVYGERGVRIQPLEDRSWNGFGNLMLPPMLSSSTADPCAAPERKS